MTNACIKGCKAREKGEQRTFSSIIQKGHKRCLEGRKAVCDTYFRTIGFDFSAAAPQLGGLRRDEREGLLLLAALGKLCLKMRRETPFGGVYIYKQIR